MSHTIIKSRFPYFFFFLRLNKTTTKTNIITITTATTTATTISVQLKSPSLSCNSRGGLDLADNLGDVILLLKLTSYVVGLFTKVDGPVLMEPTKQMTQWLLMLVL